MLLQQWLLLHHWSLARLQYMLYLKATKPPSSVITRTDMRPMSHLGVIGALSSSSATIHSDDDVGGSAVADVRSWMGTTDGAAAAQRRGSDEVLALVLLNGSAAGADQGRQTCIFMYQRIQQHAGTKSSNCSTIYYTVLDWVVSSVQNTKFILSLTAQILAFNADEHSWRSLLATKLSRNN